ncbi:MAG: hypothetical protein EG825_18235, partial [Rhodocyclaceae bacterium]|nr:hypothetical protein [Rhodocyclaceae bacterium]
VLQADNVTVRLTTSAQTPAAAYTVTCLAGRVLDIAGNGNIAGTAGFTGYSFVDTEAPSVPAPVTAANGAASPVIATISWPASTDNVAVTGYRVFRSVTATWDVGTWQSIGMTTAISFDDTTGVAGQDYYYKVSAFDAAGNESAMSASTTPAVKATWNKLPHEVYNQGTQSCKVCHEPHVAASANNILRATGATPPETGVCYACHDGSGAIANIKSGPVNTFAVTNPSGHQMLPEDTTADLTDSCAKCHNPHVNWVAGNPLPKSQINGTPVAAADNSWCLACHNATNAWYGAGYPTSANPTVNAAGFPVLGTFPTTSTPAPYVAYTDVTFNAHASIPASSTVDGARETG